MDEESVSAVMRMLGEARRLPADDQDRLRIEHTALSLVRDGQRRRKRERERALREADAAVLAATAMGSPDRVADAPVGGSPESKWQESGLPEGGLRESGSAEKAPSEDGLRGGTAREGGPSEGGLRGSGSAEEALSEDGLRGGTVRGDGPSEGRAGGGGWQGRLGRARRCYICKGPFDQVGGLYHQLCPPCAASNAARRAARTDLRGRRALVTGGRTKIGHHLALKMLHDGAHVTVTTRFPCDAARRFAAAGDWDGRLEIVGIDLRDPRQVVALTDRFLTAGDPLDILVNNAAQTLRRPPAAYAALVEGERRGLPHGAPVSTAPGFTPLFERSSEFQRFPGVEGSPGKAPVVQDGVRIVQGGGPVVWDGAPVMRDGSPVVRNGGPVVRDGVPVVQDRVRIAQGGGPVARDGSAAFPDASQVPDVSGLLPDTSSRNSWTARIGEVDPAELLEVQLVNAVAPFLLIDRLLPLLLKAPAPRRYVVNVSAVEGQFTVANKTGRHPHTNMAKAGLNMLTRTSAADLARRGVYMCSVDTGWITDEIPGPIRDHLDRRTPLDVIDGAARVYDPIVRGEAGDPVHGVFLKDYAEAPW